MLALPATANAIAGSLPSLPQTVIVPETINQVAVFDGDNRRGRVRTTRQLAAANSATVAVLGDRWIADALLEGGFPPARVIETDLTGTTRDQIAWVQQYEQRAPNARIIIVASRLQAPRVWRLTQRAHLRAAIVASPIDDEPPVSGPRLWVPTYIALRVSRDALYEHAALVYYRWRGWVD